MTAVEVCHWSDRAECEGTATHVWFEDNPAYAQTICGRCPVRVECLEHALLTGEVLGVWGGWTPAQRDGWLRWPQMRECIACGVRSSSPRCDTCRV